MSGDPQSDSINRVVTNWFKEIDQDSDSDETIVCYVSSMLEDPESLELDALEELVSGISPALACMPSAERLCKLLDLVQQVGAALPCADDCKCICMYLLCLRNVPQNININSSSTRMLRISME